MRFILIFFLMVAGIQAKAQYVLTSDTSSCLVEFYDSDTSSIRYSFDATQLRYTQRQSNTLQCFDNVATFSFKASQIDNYADLTAIKNALDLWARNCED